MRTRYKIGSYQQTYFVIDSCSSSPGRLPPTDTNACAACPSSRPTSATHSEVRFNCNRRLPGPDRCAHPARRRWPWVTPCTGAAATPPAAQSAPARRPSWSRTRVRRVAMDWMRSAAAAEEQAGTCGLRQAGGHLAQLRDRCSRAWGPEDKAQPACPAAALPIRKGVVDRHGASQSRPPRQAGRHSAARRQVSSALASSLSATASALTKVPFSMAALRP